MSGGNGILTHTLERPPGLIECQTVLDIGAGVRPMQWYRPARHFCIEPYERYVSVLEAVSCDGLRVYEVLVGTALEGLQYFAARRETFEAIYLLDVIEHMEKAEGQRVLQLAQQVATVQIVVFTPNGFKEQTRDAWGYEGHEWQTHRSGWTAEDFRGWWAITYPTPDSLFAVWCAP
jgi:hypothetical protein